MIVRDTNRRAVLLAAARGVYHDDSWFRGEAAEAELIAAEEERTTKWEAVLTLGDESVVAAPASGIG